ASCAASAGRFDSEDVVAATAEHRAGDVECVQKCSQLWDFALWLQPRLGGAPCLFVRTTVSAGAPGTPRRRTLRNVFAVEADHVAATDGVGKSAYQAVSSMSTWSGARVSAAYRCNACTLVREGWGPDCVRHRELLHPDRRHRHWESCAAAIS